MRIGRYRFAPPLWGVCVLLVGAGLLCALGVWQIERGEHKAAILAQRRAADQVPPTQFNAAAEAGSGTPEYGRRYTITGQVDAKHQALLDNQTFDGKVGYHVWTPLILSDGRRVLVDRGWIGLGPEGRRQLPSPAAPSGEVTMTGRWRALPRPGLRLADANACETSGWPRLLSYPTIAQLRCQYPGGVVDGLLLLGRGDARGFARNWQDDFDRMPPVRHYGYALQWFAMAAAVGVIFLVVNAKRIR